MTSKNLMWNYILLTLSVIVVLSRRREYPIDGWYKRCSSEDLQPTHPLTTVISPPRLCNLRWIQSTSQLKPKITWLGILWLKWYGSLSNVYIPNLGNGLAGRWSPSSRVVGEKFFAALSSYTLHGESIHLNFITFIVKQHVLEFLVSVEQ